MHGRRAGRHAETDASLLHTALAVPLTKSGLSGVPEYQLLLDHDELSHFLRPVLSRALVDLVFDTRMLNTGGP